MAISPDPLDDLAATAHAQKLSFPLLRDADGALIRLLGLVNPRYGKRMVAHPTTLVVDREGIVRWMRVDEDYRKRPSSDELLDALSGLDSPDAAQTSPGQ